MRPTAYISCGYSCKKNISVTLLPNEAAVKLDSTYSSEQVAIFSVGILVISIGIIIIMVYGHNLINKRNRILYPDNSIEINKKYNRVVPCSDPDFT